MRLRPRRLNTAIAALFMIGSFGFALGCVSAYASAVGPTADAVTFFVASLFFTTASFCQLVQSQSPGVAATGTGRDDERQPVRFLAWLPHDKGWLAAATQFPGTLFFNGTTFWAITVAVSNSQYDKVVWRPDLDPLLLTNGSEYIMTPFRTSLHRTKCRGQQKNKKLLPG